MSNLNHAETFQNRYKCFIVMPELITHMLLLDFLLASSISANPRSTVDFLFETVPRVYASRVTASRRTFIYMHTPKNASLLFNRKGVVSAEMTF